MEVTDMAVMVIHMPVMVITGITSARDLLMPNPKLMPKLSTHTSHTPVTVTHTLTVILMLQHQVSATNMSAPQQLPTESTNCTSVMLKLMPIQRHTTAMAVVMVMAVETDTDTHTGMLATDMEDTHTVMPDTALRIRWPILRISFLLTYCSTNIVLLEKNF